ncbi:MAG: adenylate/guanylate cyclase domain-containing protein [Pseudomonadota bacterium]
MHASQNPAFNLTIVRPDGKRIEQEFFGMRTVVGRQEKCELRLLDSMVSRNHCVIFKEDKRFLVKDLQSRNGTWVNGRRIKNRRRVKHGDVIQVGPFRLIFSLLEEDSSVNGLLRTRTLEFSEAHEFEPFVHKDETERVVKPIGMVSDYISETTGAIERVPTKVRRERLNRNLLTLYRITEQFVTTKDLDEILNYIMDELFEIFSPSQATVLLIEKDGVPTVRKQRSTESQGNYRAISHTIIQRIINDRVAVLTDNALEDPRFEMGESVIIDGIRSVMAAPIWEDRAMLGVLYVDKLDVVGGYQSEDLDLLTAVGHQTALAIQRWKLTEELGREAVKQAVIKQNLGRFHASQVVDLILRGDADLEVKETVATIFFCDIVGFTSLCESGNPLRLQHVLNFFFKIVNDVVFREQGTLDKFIGDGAMAIFGAPLPQEDAPERAIRAALLIREKLRESMERLSPEYRFRVRYGINTGQVIVGNFGSDERMEYTVLGHTVNLAARISRAADPDQVLIGPETYARTKQKHRFRVSAIGARRLKGLSAKTPLYVVEGWS